MLELLRHTSGMADKLFLVHGMGLQTDGWDKRRTGYFGRGGCVTWSRNHGKYIPHYLVSRDVGKLLPARRSLSVGGSRRTSFQRTSLIWSLC